MMKPTKGKLFLSLISLAVIPYVTADGTFVNKDTNCTTPDGKAGICIHIRSCQSLLSLLTRSSQKPEYIKFLKSSKCGGFGEVCCQLKSKSNPTINLSNPKSARVEGSGKTTVLQHNRVVSGAEADLDTNCTTPNGKAGICIHIRSCQSLLSLLTNSTQKPEFIKFLKRSKCGGYAEVCCPRETKNKSRDKFSRLTVGGCGKTTVSQHNKVVGGVPADLGAWPWIAVLGYKDMYSKNLEWRCGGSLINNRYILTAAHCVRISPELLISLAKVRLGEHDLLSNFDGANPVDYDIEKTIVHEEYGSQKNDIALIRLDKNVDFTDKIKPICLPQAASLRSSSFEKKHPFVVGWGETSFNGPSSDIPLQVQIPVVDNDSCKKSYAKIGAIITENQICAGENRRGKDACLGDSGGPLMFPQSGTYYQIGIISYGYKCAVPGYPGVYTRVTSYLDWIKRNIE